MRYKVELGSQVKHSNIIIQSTPVYKKKFQPFVSYKGEARKVFTAKLLNFKQIKMKNDRPITGKTKRRMTLPQQE